MPEAATDGLAVRVRGALRDPGTPLWLPELTADLADAAWRKLGRDLGLTRASYGTARVLRRDPEESRQVVVSLDVPSPEGKGCDAIPIEWLPEDLAVEYAGPEVRFFRTEEILGSDVAVCVREALEILGAVPTVLPTVCSLVRSLHLIDPVDDEIDISFS